MPTKKFETFAQRLEHLMETHDPPLSMMDLSDKLQTTYEHVRKMCRGISVPTRFVVLALADIFQVSSEELETLAKEDRFRRKFGDQSPTPIFNPEVQPFATAWPFLSDTAKADLLERLKKHVAAAVKDADKKK